MHCEPIPPGKYIVAVSGGVDSVVLLDIVMSQPGRDVVVAHVDHGVRPDSGEDARFVAGLARKYRVPYVSEAMSLGPRASEEVARQVRYEFLRSCRKKYLADAIITAHHRDDLIETIIINLVRGTGWRGLVSLRSTSTLLRPLLSVSKQDIIQYARQRQIIWREDSSNQDTRYLRNYIRHNITPRIKASETVEQQFIALASQQLKLRNDIDEEIDNILTNAAKGEDGRYVFSRYVLIMYPPRVVLEILRAAVQHLTGSPLLRAQAEGLLLFTKSARPGAQHNPTKGVRCMVTQTELIVEPV